MKSYLRKPLLSVLSATLIIIAVSGCASSVSDVKDTDPMISKSINSPEIAAKCVVQNIDNNHGKFLAILRNGDIKNTFTVIVRSDAAGNAAIIEFEPMNDGALITSRVSNHYPFKSFLKNSFIEGC